MFCGEKKNNFREIFAGKETLLWWRNKNFGYVAFLCRDFRQKVCKNISKTKIFSIFYELEQDIFVSILLERNDLE